MDNGTSEEISPIQELERLVGKPIIRTVMVNGESVKIEIGRLKAGMIPRAVAAAGSLLVYLTDKQQKLNWEQLVLLHPNEVLSLIAVCTKQPREVIEELELDDLVLIITDLVEMNLGFFVHRVLPVLSGGLQRLFVNAKDVVEKLRQVTGAMSSNDSSPPDTPSGT